MHSCWYTWLDALVDGTVHFRTQDLAQKYRMLSDVECARVPITRQHSSSAEAWSENLTVSVRNVLRFMVSCCNLYRPDVRERTKLVYDNICNCPLKNSSVYYYEHNRPWTPVRMTIMDFSALCRWISGISNSSESSTFDTLVTSLQLQLSLVSSELLQIYWIQSCCLFSSVLEKLLTSLSS